MDKNKIAVSTFNKIAEIYVKQYFDYSLDDLILKIFSNFLNKNSKILEVGSGPGAIVKYLLEKGFKAQGIDLSKEMLRISKKKVPEAKFRLMDMRKLKFQDKSFDGLVSAYSLIHIPSEQIPAVLKGFHRVLKTNGVMLIIAQKGKADKVVDEPFLPGEKMFFNFFNKKRLSKFLKDADFNIIYQKEIKDNDAESISGKLIYTISRKRD